MSLYLVWLDATFSPGFPGDCVFTSATNICCQIWAGIMLSFVTTNPRTNSRALSDFRHFPHFTLLSLCVLVLNLLPYFLLSSLPFWTPSVFSLTLSRVAIDKSDPDMVEALVGQTVVLPCRVSPPPSSTVMVEWRRDGVAVSSLRCACWHVLSLTHWLTDLLSNFFALTSGTTNSLTAPCCSAL